LTERPLRAELGRLAELAGLVGFAVVQPVLGPFGESPQTFVAFGATAGDIVRFGVALVVVPLLVLAGLGALARLGGERVRGWVHTGLVGLLAGLAGVYAARDLGRSGGLELNAGARVALGIAVAVAAAFAHRRWQLARTYLRFTAPVPFLLLFLFLFASPVASLVRPASADVGSRRTGDHPSVVVVVLDELPTLSLVDQGQIDAERFPNLAAFAATSTWYRNATTVAPETSMAVPAIVTGRLPGEDNEPAVVRSHPDSLFTLLAPTHRVHATEWVTSLCPEEACPDGPPAITPEAAQLAPSLATAPPSALGSLLDIAEAVWWGQAWPTAEPPQVDFAEPGASDPEGLVRPGLRFLSSLRDAGDGRPVLDYVHMPLPHQPWYVLPSGSAYDGAHPAFGLEFLAWPDSAEGADLAAAGHARHQLQLQWADRMLGEAFEQLQELGRWDDSVVVVTADHGISFTPGQFARGAGPDNLVELAWVPLLVKAPGQTTAEVVDGNAMTIDILPTIAELAGVDVPWDTDGRSLVDGHALDRARKVMRPSLVHPWRGPLDDDGFVELESDGLAAIAGAARPAPPSGPDDELLGYRFGRHGDLLGQRVDDLGVCADGPGTSAVEVDRSDDWDEYFVRHEAVDDRIPAWIEGYAANELVRDVAAALDGEIAGWSVARPTFDGGWFGMVLAEPVMQRSTGDLRLYAVVDGSDCRLEPLDTSGP
jgi:hypothetical protein